MAVIYYGNGPDQGVYEYIPSEGSMGVAIDAPVTLHAFSIGVVYAGAVSVTADAPITVWHLGGFSPEVSFTTGVSAFNFYNSFKKELMDGTIDLDSNTIYAMLVTSSYGFNADTHTRRNNITNEVTGTGYTTGGAAITSKVVTKDDTGDVAVFDGADVIWGSSTITARGVVIYKSTGAATTDNLICFIDFGADGVSTGGAYTLNWHSAGIFAMGA